MFEIKVYGVIGENIRVFIWLWAYLIIKVHPKNKWTYLKLKRLT